MSAPTPFSPNGAGAGGEGTRVQASSNSIRGKARGLVVLRCMVSFLLSKLKGSKGRGLERATARREPTFLVTKGKVGSLVCQHSNVTAVELGLGGWAYLEPAPQPEFGERKTIGSVDPCGRNATVTAGAGRQDTNERRNVRGRICLPTRSLVVRRVLWNHTVCSPVKEHGRVLQRSCQVSKKVL